MGQITICSHFRTHWKFPPPASIWSCRVMWFSLSQLGKIKLSYKYWHHSIWPINSGLQHFKHNHLAEITYFRFLNLAHPTTIIIASKLNIVSWCNSHIIWLNSCVKDWDCCYLHSIFKNELIVWLKTKCTIFDHTPYSHKWHKCPFLHICLIYVSF